MTTYEEFEQSEKIAKEYTDFVYKHNKTAQCEFIVILWHIKLNIANYNIVEVGELEHYYFVNYKCFPADGRKVEAIRSCFIGYIRTLDIAKSFAGNLCEICGEKSTSLFNKKTNESVDHFLKDGKKYNAICIKCCQKGAEFVFTKRAIEITNRFIEYFDGKSNEQQ